jgi:hypothetical protein
MFLGANGIVVHVNDADAVYFTQCAASCTEAERRNVESAIAQWLRMASPENRRAA